MRLGRTQPNLYMIFFYDVATVIYVYGIDGIVQSEYVGKES